MVLLPISFFLCICLYVYVLLLLFFSFWCNGTVASQQKGLNLPTDCGLCLCSLHVLPLPAWVSSHISKTCRLPQLATLNCQCVNASLYGCLSVLALNYLANSLPRVYPASCLKSIGIGYSFPVTLTDRQHR